MQFVAFLRLVAVSRYFPVVLTLDGCIVAAIVGNAIGQVRLNVWQGSFYDSISRRDVNSFITQVWLFLAIIAGLVVLGVIQTTCHELLKVKLREALTRDLLDHWLAPGRAAKLAQAGEIGTNPDQRLQEDARHLTELSADLAVGLLQSSLLLVSFIGVLWVLSGKLELPIGGRPVQIPGFMVWAALIYAVLGSLAAWLVGRPLISLNAERYAREADFRFALVRTSEWIDTITLQSGEARERQVLDGTVDRVLFLMRRLAFRLGKLNFVTATYGYGAIVAPIAVASPGYFMGSLSFGDLMIVAGAFTQVQQALRWFVDNFSRIADWHATFNRVMGFRAAMLALDDDQGAGSSIRFVRKPTTAITFQDFSMSLTEGDVAFTDTDPQIGLGDHVLISGGSASARGALVRTLAGTWRRGAGQVLLPPRGDAVAILTQRPYLPLGTLADALAYPDDPSRFTPRTMHKALRRTGFEGAVEQELTMVRRWDKDLTMNEQQCLAFARLLLHTPRWIILDGALETFDEDALVRVEGILENELAQSAIIHVGDATSAGRLFPLRLTLGPAKPAVFDEVPPGKAKIVPRLKAVSR